MLTLYNRKIIYADYACPACNLRWKDQGFYVFPQQRVLCPEHKARLLAMMHRQDTETDKYTLVRWVPFARKRSRWG